jgi:multiple sugar transport system substrate-binding protein
MPAIAANRTNMPNAFRHRRRRLHSRPAWCATAVAAVTVTAMLSACAGVDPAPNRQDATAKVAAVPLAADDQAAPVTLTWWTGQTADAGKLLESLATEFTKAHPNVKIEVSPGASTTDQLLQKLSASFAANTYPDITYAFGSWASELAASGRTLDLTGSVKDPAVAWQEFPQAARATATVNDAVIGLPAVVGNLALLYNKKLFDDAGVPQPTNDMTWEQFRQAAKKLTDRAHNVYGTAYDVTGGEGTTWAMWPQLWQNGGDILSKDEKTATFNSDAGVETVDFWRAMAQDDKSVYLDQTGAKSGPLFASGNIGMLISGPWQLYGLKEAKTPYGVTNLPGTNGDHQTVMGADLWILFDHKDANRAYWAYEFTKWLTSAEQDQRWNLARGNLPLRSSERQGAAFTEAEGNVPGYAVFAQNLDNAKKPRPTVEGYVGLSKAFGETVSKILQAQLETKPGLDAAKAKADKSLSDQ